MIVIVPLVFNSTLPPWLAMAASAASLVTRCILWCTTLPALLCLNHLLSLCIEAILGVLCHLILSGSAVL